MARKSAEGGDVIRELWGSTTFFAPGDLRSWRIGPCRFWIERGADDWRVAFESPTGAAPGRAWKAVVAGREAPPSGLVWSRVMEERGERISVRPSLPDRPVVVRPTSPITIPAGHRARFFVHMPIFVVVRTEGAHGTTPIAERATVRLSDTWFGEPDGGELCYSFSSELYTRPEAVAASHHAVICPIVIVNESDTALDFQRICVRVQYLSLFSGARSLYTNEVAFHYRGPTQSSQIVFSEQLPEFGGPVQAIAPPRVLPSKGLFQKSFEYFKFLTTY